MKCPACSHNNKDPKRLSYTATTIDKLKLFDERKILCCSACNFGMIESDVDEDTLLRYYSSEYAGKARKQAETKSNISYVDIRTSYSADLRSLSQLALLRQYIDLSGPITIIEIGPGMGNLLFSLKQLGFVGKHISFEPQIQAHPFLQQFGSVIEKDNFNEKNAKKYSNSADLVFMSHALEHFNPGKIATIIDSISLMLKKDGIFFCEVPNANLLKYPNAGERVVPHLSFFSPEALSHFVMNSGMDIRCLQTCGEPQFEKDVHKEIAQLDKKGHFVFDFDEGNGVLRNRKYHEYLSSEKKKYVKRQKLISVCIKLFGKRIFFLLLNKFRKFRQKSFNSLISSSYFSYGPDKEFIRMISVK